MWPFGGRFFPGTNLQDLNLDWIIQRVRDLSKGILAPFINQANYHWMVYDTAAETFVDSGVSAAGEGTGPQGEPGKSPVIGTNGNWYSWDPETEAYVDTGVRAQGPQGEQGEQGEQGPQGVPGPGVNPNLLYNAYFKYGAVIDAEHPYTPMGTFPINQRGQALYDNGGSYCIDGWYATLNNPNLTITSDGINLTGVGTDTAYIRQIVDMPFEEFAGKTMTYSVLCLDDNHNVVLATGTGTVPAEVPSTGISTTIINLSSQIPHGGNTYNRLIIYHSDRTLRVQIGQNKGSTTFIAAKLEIGDVQTLAHQENGVWTVNEVPDWGEELYRCQRFLQWIAIPIGSGYSASVGSGICWLSTEARITVPLARPMRTTPTVTVTNASVSIYLAGNTDAYTPTDITAGGSVYRNSAFRNSLGLRCTIEGGTAKALAEMVLTGAGNPSGLLLSCEIT